MYSSLQKAIVDLEKHGHLVRIREEIDPNLEMAEIQRRVYAANGPAILFEKVKGSPFPALANLYGSEERCKFLFRKTLAGVQGMVDAKVEGPASVFKNLSRLPELIKCGTSALPLPTRKANVEWGETTIDQLPLIKSWPMDGGAFITLPQVYSEDPTKPGWRHSNLGMYRVQLTGNEYETNKEIGLHYQIHRGIGVHHTKALDQGEDLKVSIFIGGPPSHTFAAVMPLPEDLPELAFAGALAGKNYRYCYRDGFFLNADADFVITGTISRETKPEGPFGDHLGYYSLQHEFPAIKVHKVYHRKDAIWPFTVVGRPPQEDTHFGAMVHWISGGAVASELPGVKDLHAVDASGVHPLLLVEGSERYTPYQKLDKPQELLTQANAVLGFGQCSLAKYLMIVTKQNQPDLNIHNIPQFFQHVLERVDLTRDLHFQTRTTMDTLDYSGIGVNSGSKLVIAASGKQKRSLWEEVPPDLHLTQGFEAPHIALPGILILQSRKWQGQIQAQAEIKQLAEALAKDVLDGLPMIVVVDDSKFTAASLNNFLWVTFTRSNPSHDLYGVREFIEHKHWGCKGPMIIDARIKVHHAPPLVEDADVSFKVDQLFESGLFDFLPNKVDHLKGNLIERRPQ